MINKAAFLTQDNLLSVRILKSVLTESKIVPVDFDGVFTLRYGLTIVKIERNLTARCDEEERAPGEERKGIEL